MVTPALMMFQSKSKQVCIKRFLQVIDVMNLCFMHALLYNTHISKFQADVDPGPL